ncbi:MAG TPA: hypothetical protein VI818_08190 [Candidatus Thermoplasmatota archaeon]|nr:hypothetical protein [Candidatus Thermoplasmatota archaeon]
MNLKTPVLLAIVSLVAGCVDAGQPTTEAPTVPPSSTDANLNVRPLNVTMGLLTIPFTTETSAAYFVSSTGPVAVTLRLNGTVTATETVSGNKSWTLPLEFGSQDLNVTVAGAGLQRHDNLTLVRLALTKIIVDYGSYHPSSPGTPKADARDLWVNVDERPSAPQYAAQGAQPLDAFTAHDQLVIFEKVTGKKVEVAWSASLRQFSVSRIDGAGNPVHSSAPPWWCYKVNDKAADGMSIQPVRPGDTVKWNLGTCS